MKLFCQLCRFFAPFAVIVHLFSRRFSHMSRPKEISVWSFQPNIARSEDMIDHRSYAHNLSSCEIKALAGDDAT